MLAQYRCKLAEYLHPSWDLPTIVHNHSAIIDLIKLPKETYKHPHLMVQATTDSVNKGVNENGNRVPTKNTMFADDNLLPGM